MKLTRKAVKQALETVPVDQILGVPGELTHKQREFARLVAMGNTGADAYRKAYKNNAKPKTAGNTASDLKKHPGISREIEAYRLANEAAKYRTAEQLRELVIHTLVQVAIDPDTKQAQRIQAAKTLGTVTEVAAFTNRTEVKHVKSAEDAKAALLAKLRAVMQGDAVDVTAKAAADSLIHEITGNTDTLESSTDQSSGDALETLPESQSAEHAEGPAMYVDAQHDSATHDDDQSADRVAVDSPADQPATPTAPNAVWSPTGPIHTNPHTRIQSESTHTQSQPKSTPTPSDFSAESLEAELETPPLVKTK